MNHSKILFSDNLLHSLLNFRGGVINALSGQNLEVILLAPRDSRELPELNNRIRLVPVNFKRHGTNIFFDLTYLFKVWHIYRKERPDFIFHYTIKPNIYGTIAARVLGIPSAMIVPGFGYVFSDRSFHSRMARVLYKLSSTLASQVIVLNQRDKELVISHKIAPPRKVLWLKCGEGVNIHHYQPNPFSENHKETVDFLFIGRLIREKGIIEFIEAAALIKEQYPNCHFHILGDFDLSHPGAVKPEQIKAFQDEGLIIYHGVAGDIRPFIQSADCIVLPSWYNEGLNRSLMEGLATAKPVITTDNPGCEETVRDTVNGYLVKKKDIASLVEGIRRFLALSHQERIRMGKKSRELAVKLFDEKFVIEEYKNLISKFTGIQLK